jgi:hypothetical protein
MVRAGPSISGHSNKSKANMSQSTASPDHLEVAQTRSHALLAHQHFAGVQLRGVAGLTAAIVATAPIVIDDLNCEPLYHDYALTNGGAGSERSVAPLTRSSRRTVVKAEQQ